MTKIIDRVFSPGVVYKRGRNLILENFRVAELVEDLFKTSLGPYGNSKILFVKETGDYKVTKDGSLMFKDVGMVHPIVKLMVDGGEAVKSEAGDGSLNTIVFCGKLLRKARKLYEQGFHPSTIIRGFNKALKFALQLVTSAAQRIELTDRELLRNLARTCLCTKLDLQSSETISDLVVKMISATYSLKSSGFDLDKLKVEGRAGGSIEDSMLVDGLVIHKFGVDDMMPKKIDDARIAIIEKTLGIERPGSSFMISLRNPSDIPRLFRQRYEILDDLVDPIVEADVNVVLCTKNIDPEVGRLFADKGILAIRNVQPKDIYNLKSATGATPVADPRELKEEFIGECGLVEQRIIAAQDRWTFFERCKNRYIRSMLIRGVTDAIVDEVKNAVRYCLRTVFLAIDGPGVVAGGGALESYVAWRLRNLALKYPSREQVVIECFADALEDLAVTLAENAGMDPVLTRLRLRSESVAGAMRGIDVFRRRIADTFDLGIVDAAHVKIAYMKSATETALTILRIDHYIKQPEKVVEKKTPIPEPVKKVREESEKTYRKLSSSGI